MTDNNKTLLSMAVASLNSNHFIGPLMDEMIAAGLDEDSITIEATEDGALKVSIAGIDNQLVEALLYESIVASGMEELDLNYTVVASEDDSHMVLAVDEWNSTYLEEAAKRPLDEDDDGEDDEEDEDEEDEDAEEGDGEVVPIKVKRKADGTPILTVLTTPEAQKMVTRMYGISSGDDMSRFPQFWQELDGLCKKYRADSGYVPDDGKETASVTEQGNFDEHGSLEESLAHYLELAKKKGKKKGFKDGRGGFLSAFMGAVAAKGDELDAAWTSLDDEKIVNLMVGFGEAVIDKLMAEREKRGLGKDDAE